MPPCALQRFSAGVVDGAAEAGPATAPMNPAATITLAAAIRILRVMSSFPFRGQATYADPSSLSTGASLHPSRAGQESPHHGPLRHRLLRKPDRVQRLLAVKVVVGLDGEPVPKAVNDREGLRIGRVRVLPDHARAGDQAAVADLDQLVEADLDRPEQIDQVLHPFERRGTSSVNTGIGPARSLAVDGILGPELLGHRCRTRLVPDPIGPADAVDVLLRHHLLPQPGGRVPNLP